MRVEEIQMLSGMERENIYFYEREKLISSVWIESGYSSYSEEDLNILLRIKLLRSLHISLEEIKELKNGTKRLSDTLTQQIMLLEQEEQGEDNAQEVCREICQDGVGFYNLDAKKYLKCMGITDYEDSIAGFMVRGNPFARVFHPWRRWMARTLDVFLYSCMWNVPLALIFHVNLGARSIVGELLDTLIAVLMMLLLEPLFLSILGTTPGKAIFGLIIRGRDGRRLSYAKGLERVWGVLGKGMGYSIPIYNLVRLWKSYKLCSENEIQPWDEDISYTIKDTKWSEKPKDKTYSVNIARMETPEFSYTVENDHITGVSFNLELKNNKKWLLSNNPQMILAGLSYAGAQKKIGIFSNDRRQMVKQL